MKDQSDHARNASGKILSDCLDTARTVGNERSAVVINLAASGIFFFSSFFFLFFLPLAKR